MQQNHYINDPNHYCIPLYQFHFHNTFLPAWSMLVRYLLIRCLSVSPLQKFSYFPSLVFSGFLQQVSLFQMQKSDEARFLKKNLVFPKFWKIGQKINLFRFISKSCHQFSSVNGIQLEGKSGLILPKTAYSAKIRFRSYGPKRPKNRVFSKAHISRTEIAIENLIRFSESSVLFLQKISLSDFPYLDPFTLKIESEHWNRKSPNSGFSIFLSLGGRIFFILHSQLEDHKGLLQ